MVTKETDRDVEAGPRTTKSFQSQATPSEFRLKRTQTQSSFLDYDKFESAVFQERLGTFDRISPLTFWLILICLLLGCGAYLLIQIQLNDDKWEKVIHGKSKFPNLEKTPRRRNPYFEEQFIHDTDLGRAIKLRTKWVKGGLDFGLARPTLFDWVTTCILISILGVCLLHLILLCLLDLFRNSFMVISLGYGFIGLFTFSLCLTTLFHAFVHQTASYLENAKSPPTNINSNDTRDDFIALNIACAFAFSSPNPFVNYSSKPRPDGSFIVNGSAEYDKLEMIELGLCPKQDFLLIAMVILFITALLSWFVAAYSETVQNRILGPPVWLERFKLKRSKGHRQWQQRKLGASRSHMSMKSDQGILNPSMSFNDQRKWLEKNPKRDPIIEDAYNILDGGIDHIILEDPNVDLTMTASVGTIRYYDKYFSAQHFNK